MSVLTVSTVNVNGIRAAAAKGFTEWLATTTPGRCISRYRPLSSNSGSPNPVRTSSGSTRLYSETPLRPFATEGACAANHPSGATTDAGSCAASARTS